MVWSAMWVIARGIVSGEETSNLFFYSECCNHHCECCNHHCECCNHQCGCCNHHCECCNHQCGYCTIPYSMRGGVSSKYSMRRSWVLYLPRDPTPHAVFYCTARVYDAFTDLLVLSRGLIASAWTWGWENGFTKMLNKLTEPVVSPFVLPNQLEINDMQVWWHKLICSHAAGILGGFL